MRLGRIAVPGSALTSRRETQRDRALRTSFAGTCRDRKKNEMKPTSKKFTPSAAAVFTFAFLVMMAPAAQADDYCITNGAQAAHGCGYPSMETCRAASSGIGGSCSLSSSSKNPSDAQAYQPKQPHSRSGLRSRQAPTGN
jgi:hypothetical protein